MYNSGIASEKELLEARQEVIIAQTEEKRIKEPYLSFTNVKKTIEKYNKL